MALSLKQVEKRQQNLFKNNKKDKKAVNEVDSPAQVKDDDLSRPWKSSIEPVEFVAATHPTMDEHQEAHASEPVNKISEIIDLAQKNSYILSKWTKKWSWWQQIKIYPKVNIPVPSIFHQKDKG